MGIFTEILGLSSEVVGLFEGLAGLGRSYISLSLLGFYSVKVSWSWKRMPFLEMKLMALSSMAGRVLLMASTL